MWELTPHSLVNGAHVYYHANEAYFPNGAPNVETFTGIDTSNTVVAYGIDGEGRWTSAEIGSANEITSVAYNAAQQPLAIDLLPDFRTSPSMISDEGKGKRYVEELKQLEAGRKAEDVAREVGVSKHTLYAWKAKYGGMDVSQAQEAKQLRDENTKLRKLVADLSLDKEALQSVIRKNGWSS